MLIGQIVKTWPQTDSTGCCLDAASRGACCWQAQVRRRPARLAPATAYGAAPVAEASCAVARAWAASNTAVRSWACASAASSRAAHSSARAERLSRSASQVRRSGGRASSVIALLPSVSR